MRVLLADADKQFAEKLQTALLSVYFSTLVVERGEFVLNLNAAIPFDLITLDTQLIDTGGLKVLQKMRAQGISTPVLMTSRDSKLKTRLDGINSGADDFMVKPFSEEEFIARVRAITRRAFGAASNSIPFGKFILDFGAHNVRTNTGALLMLTGYEYNILELLVLNKGKTIPRKTFMDKLYADAKRVPGEKTINTFINRLRNMLAVYDPDFIYIQSNPGTGYTMLSEPMHQSEEDVTQKARTPSRYAERDDPKLTVVKN